MLMYKKDSKTGISVDQHQIEILKKAGWSKEPVKELKKELGKEKPVDVSKNTTKATTSSTTTTTDTKK